MFDGETPSQVAEPTQDTVLSEGAPTPQAPVAVEETPPGAEVQEAPITKAAPAKTYTQAELDAVQGQLMAAKDREIQQHKDALAQVAMREQIAQMQATEAQARAKDNADVEAGILTEPDAAARAQARLQTLQAQAQLQAMNQQGEALARVVMAHDLAKEYGVDPDALAKDASLTSPLLMVRKAAALALKARDVELRILKAKPETFDKGPQAETTGQSSEEQRLRTRYPSMYPK